MMRKFLTLAVALSVGAVSAETWYKIGSDASDKPSWTKSYDDTHGWATDRTATKTDREMTVTDADDFVIAGALQLRTPNSSVAFGGHSLTLTEGGEVLLKAKDVKNTVRNITITNLQVVGQGGLNSGTDYLQFDLFGNVDIATDSIFQLKFNTSSTNTDDHRDIGLQMAVTGDDTAAIDLYVSGKTTNKARAWLDGPMSNFTGRVFSSTSNVVNTTEYYLYLRNLFNGIFESLPGSTRVFEVNYDALMGGKGLRWSSTTVPDALKTTLVLYSATTDLFVDGLPVITFPAGTEVDPAEFTVRCRQSYIELPDGTEQVFCLKKVVNEDDSVTLAVDAANPVYASLVEVGADDWEWRFFDQDRQDVTGTCGLTEPNRYVKVEFRSQAEFDRLKTRSFASCGVLFAMTELSADMTLTGMDFRLLPNATIDLLGHHLALPGSVMAALSEGTKLTSTVAGAVLEIDVPSGEAETVTKIAIEGGKNLRVWKIGLGRLTMGRTQYFGEPDSANTGIAPSFIVKEGVAAKTGKMSSNNGPLGKQYVNIQVCEGAQFDLKGRDCWDYNYYIAGSGPDGSGALVSSVSYSKPTSGGDGTHFRHLYLDADAAIGGSVSWALNFNNNNNHNVSFREHTLSLVADNRIYWIRLNPTDAGKLVINQAEVCTADVDCSQVDVEVLTLLDSNAGHYFNPVKSLKFAPEATWTGVGDPATASTVVFETYRPSTNAMPTVTLGNADHRTPTLDLSTQTTTLDGTGLSFYEGAIVTVDIGERKIAAADRKLVAWDRPPADVSFKHVGAKKCSLVKCDDGLYYESGFAVIVR